MTQTDRYIIKLKGAGVKSNDIAAKLALTPTEVDQRYERIVRDHQTRGVNGYFNLCAVFTDMCKRYENLGESYKMMGEALGAVMDDDDLQELVSDDKEETISNLKTKAIVLRPFMLPPPPEPKEDGK